MQGVTTAIVAFIFLCVAFPHLVKNRPQFYAALAATVLIILLDALAAMVGAEAFGVFVYVMIALVQVAAILLLVLAAGGVTIGELAGDLSRAYEVIRRGEEEKEIIVPLTGQQPPVAKPGHFPSKREDEPPRTVHEINWPEPPAASPAPPVSPAQPEPPPASAQPPPEPAAQREPDASPQPRGKPGTSLPLE